jgi:coniferyl-aldehyde dehydrogenase
MTQVQDNSAEALMELLQRQRADQQRAPADLSRRRSDLKALEALVRDNEAALSEAVSSDFGHRSPQETLISDLAMVVHEIRHMHRHLPAWMKPRRVATDWRFWPAKNRLLRQPLGVVGIISPWNYPVNLALVPLATALAGGNHAMLKPSEFTPATSELLEKLLAQYFPPERVAVVQGEAAVAAAFSSLPFDHLFFTGSTAVGRKVMQAAAEQLVPVTLELGGKSPAIIHGGYPLPRAAERIAAGKFLNAGQTCIAPDYVLLPADRLDAFVAQLTTIINRSFPSGLGNNPDYTRIINRGHYQRLRGLIEDARDKGARVIEVLPAGPEPKLEEKRVLPPTILVDVTDDMKVMQEEIFGPVLPVRSAEGLDGAIDYVNARPRPLALYYFDRGHRRQRRLLRSVVAGGICFNDTVMHFAQKNQPFGGVGASGMGSYHGHWGFETMTKPTPVFIQSRLNAGRFLAPPYGKLAQRLARLLMR